MDPLKISPRQDLQLGERKSLGIRDRNSGPRGRGARALGWNAGRAWLSDSIFLMRRGIGFWLSVAPRLIVGLVVRVEMGDSGMAGRLSAVGREDACENHEKRNWRVGCLRHDFCSHSF